jgi:hypothetical protein
MSWCGAVRRFVITASPLKDGDHPLTGATRINLTFRKVF